MAIAIGKPALSAVTENQKRQGVIVRSTIGALIVALTIRPTIGARDE